MSEFKLVITDKIKNELIAAGWVPPKPTVNKLSEYCVWTQDDAGSDMWSTDCNNNFVIYEGYPSENGMNYCCYCGKKLKENIFDESQSLSDQGISFNKCKPESIRSREL